MSYNKNTQMYEGYIYCIENKINNKKYIGQTSRTINIRFYEHVKANDDFYVHRAMRKYGVENFDVYQVDMCICDSYEKLSCLLDEKEMYWIKYYSSVLEGYNCTYGGGDSSHLCASRSVLCYNLNGEFLCKYNSIQEASTMNNCDQSSIARSCISPYEYKRAANKLYRYEENPLDDSEIEIIKLKYPKIYQYDFDGNLLNVFDSLIDAERYLKDNGINALSDNIGYACRTDNKSASGFIWRKYPDSFDTYKLPTKQIRKVERRDMFSGELLDTYRSIEDAAKAIGIMPSCIYANCNDSYKGNSSAGYYWCYEGTFDIDTFKNLRYHKRRVDRYTKYGVYIDSFDSINEASKALNKSPSKIGSVCNGKRKTAYGYVWRFFGDAFGKYNYNSNKNRQINMYTLDDIFIKTFSSVASVQAEESFSDVTGIYKCCKHVAKTALGYKWYYADDNTQPDVTKIVTQ